LKIAEYLSAFFLDVLRLTPSGLIEVVYLCANKVRFDFLPEKKISNRQRKQKSLNKFQFASAC